MAKNHSELEPDSVSAPGIPGLRVHIPRLLNAEEPVQTLARFVVNTRFEDLASETVEFAKRLTIDVLGITIAGSSQVAISEVVDYVKACGGTPQSTLPFFGGRYPASFVALALAPMSRALDMGDVHLGWPEQGFSVVGHTAEYTAPTILAACGLVPCVTGKEFLTAFAVATEVLVRIGAAAQNTASGRLMGLDSNFDQGGWFIFGAVAAAARIMGLNVEQTVNAFGMAKCMTQTHDMKSMAPASHMVRLHHGFVAKNAIDVCELARRGLNGPRDVMLGYRGFLFAVSRGLWPVKPELLVRDLATTWFFTHTSIKPFSACKATHTAASGLLRLMAENKLSCDKIDSIEFGISPNAYELVCKPHADKWHPCSDQNAQFSLPHVVATVAIDGGLMIDGYQTPARDRPQVRALRERIQAHVDPTVGTLDARVILRLKDGTKIEMLSNDCKGSPRMPLSDKEWETRFYGLCRYCRTPLPLTTVSTLLDRLFHLEQSLDINADLIQPLTPN